ncbi:MAG: hypothetical protein ACO1OY_10745 [Ramlibacter sp.]
MKSRLPRWRTLVVAAASAVSALAAAAPVHVGNGIVYECGGVGLESQERMVTASDRRDMLLTFADEHGSFLADVHVRITAPSGQVLLRANCPGPLMLVDLPAQGPVQVAASFQGREQRKPVTIGKKATRVSFIWPTS